MMTVIRFPTSIRWALFVSIRTEIVRIGIVHPIPNRTGQAHRVMIRGQVQTIGEGNAFVCMKYAYKIGGQGNVVSVSTGAPPNKSGR